MSIICCSTSWSFKLFILQWKICLSICLPMHFSFLYDFIDIFFVFIVRFQVWKMRNLHFSLGFFPIFHRHWFLHQNGFGIILCKFHTYHLLRSSSGKFWFIDWHITMDYLFSVSLSISTSFDSRSIPFGSNQLIGVVSFLSCLTFRWKCWMALSFHPLNKNSFVHSLSLAIAHHRCEPVNCFAFYAIRKRFTDSDL